jgi:hypothetical protein
MKRAGSESASGSGSIIQRHGSADPDPDPHQNVMDPQYCPKGTQVSLPRGLYDVPPEPVVGREEPRLLLGRGGGGQARGARSAWLVWRSPLTEVPVCALV